MFKSKSKPSFFGRLKSAGHEEEEVDVEVLHDDGFTTIAANNDYDEAGELSVDVYQNRNDIVIKAMVAGVKPDDLDVSISRDVVKITGKRETERTIEDGSYYFKELYWGSFSRTIQLPEEVDVDDAEAIEKHGLLIITLPKLDKHRQAKLKVRG